LSNLQKGADLAASNGVYNMNGNSSKELGDSRVYLLMSDRDLFFLDRVMVIVAVELDVELRCCAIAIF
jgi:hypothetical protein